MFEECRTEGDFTLSSGRKSKVFYDFDLLTPQEVAVYVEQLTRQVPDELFDKVDFIAAPALGGIIPGWIVSFARHKPLVIVDKKGKRRGPESATGKYLIVDDVITSFQTVARVRLSLPEMECLGVMAYVFRGFYKDLESFKDLPVYYLARKGPEE